MLLGRKLYAAGDLIGALAAYHKASSLVTDGPVAEEALFSLGLVYAHAANPKRDYGRSAAFFRKLAGAFPEGTFTEQARVFTAILRENEELSRKVERLNDIIEQSKKVDIGIEDRKRGRTR